MDGRDLLAVREIAHAFLVAEHPSDVQQFALSRVTPLLGASFSLVMQLGADGELLRPVAQHEWPAAHRSWIGALRVRVGDGPSGLAVAERRLVEVEDLFADPTLGGWHEVAKELGFRSIIAAPLEVPEGPIGAVAFYFTDATSLSDEQRSLVRLVADQMAAATDKARRLDALRRANAALADANAELETRAEAWREAEDDRREVETLVLDAMLALTAPVAGGEASAAATNARDAMMRLTAVRSLARVAREYAAVTTPMADGSALLRDGEDIDPRVAVQAAVASWRRVAPSISVQMVEPPVLLPTIRTRAVLLQRALELVVGLGVLGATTERGVVRIAISPGQDSLSLTVSWDGRPILPTADQPLPASSRILRIRDDALSLEAHDPYLAVRQSVTAADLPMAQALVARLGGDLRLDDGRDDPAGAQSITVVFPVFSGHA
ncbi:MAG TPA: GAF domain-containing protein [Gemmatimonas sp.]|uniref:GAF domain-containing protein n=1 Tax=Gemmatimonas sp. TaxID=1962908 RepID=UPI002EDA7164